MWKFLIGVLILALVVALWKYVALIAGVVLVIRAIMGFMGKLNMKKYVMLLSLIGGLILTTISVGTIGGEKTKDVAEPKQEEVVKENEPTEEAKEENKQAIEDESTESDDRNAKKEDDLKEEQNNEAKVQEPTDEQNNEANIQQQKNEAKTQETKEEPKDVSHGVKATVTDVVDGDTLEVSMNGKEEDVRLLLIDTPETKHPREPVQPFGPEASTYAEKVLEGKTVEIQVGVEERDKYGRLLAYVWIGDRTFQEMILEKGFARTAYLYNDLTMLDEFHKAQDIARNKGIGVWSIPGYAHVDHNHGYHYEEPEPKPEPKPQPKEQPKQSYQYDPWGPDRDCGDFNSWRSAQDFFDARSGDPHRLDRDGDGVACDSLR